MLGYRGASLSMARSLMILTLPSQIRTAAESSLDSQLPKAMIILMLYSFSPICSFFLFSFHFWQPSLFSFVLQEIRSVPGGEFLGSIDSMSLQVCVRQGTQIVIHPDQQRQWTSSGAEIEAEFKSLKSDHDRLYASALSQVIKERGQTTTSVVEACGEDDDGGEAGADAAAPVQDAESTATPVTFESVEKLLEKDPAENRCSSEVAGIELFLGKSGNVYICSEKDRILGKFSVLGGFGTGKHLGSFSLQVLFFSIKCNQEIKQSNVSISFFESIRVVSHF